MKILKLHTDWTKSEQRKKDNSYGGCGYYRSVKVAEYLRPEHEVDMWGREWSEKHAELGGDNEKFYRYIFDTYDIIWTHYIDNAKLFAWMYATNQQYKKKIVVDIDDNFLDVDEDNPAKNLYKANPMSKANLGAILSFADAITVSTKPLKERLQKHLKELHSIEKPIFVLPNYNDIADWNHEKVKSENGVVIGYMGSVSHAGDLKIVLPHIKRLLEKYPDVGFQLMGQLTVKEAKKTFKDWSKSIRDRLYLINPTSNQKEFPYWFAQQPWDIGIAPLAQTVFNESKSHIKWMEYAMYKIPCVASRVYPYCMDLKGKQTIQDGVTGVFAKDDQWFEKLSELIENKELREKIGQNAYEYVAQNWQYKDNKQEILDVVESIRNV